MAGLPDVDDVQVVAHGQRRPDLRVMVTTSPCERA